MMSRLATSKIPFPLLIAFELVSTKDFLEAAYCLSVAFKHQ